jgi:hypothetical protein
LNFLVCLLTLKLFISQQAQAVMAVIVWYLDLNLPIQSVPVTINVVSLNPAHGKVYSIQHYVIKFVSDLQQVSGFFPDTLVSSKKKLIAEILLKVALNTITRALTLQKHHFIHA